MLPPSDERSDGAKAKAMAEPVATTRVKASTVPSMDTSAARGV